MIGAVSMDLTTIDITDCGDVHIGDEAVIIGGQYTAADMAQASGHYQLRDPDWHRKSGSARLQQRSVNSLVLRNDLFGAESRQRSLTRSFRY